MKVTRQGKCALWSGASAAVIALAAPAVFAQEDTQRKFETIVVTTEKREASIQDVPIAVSAFDPDSLDDLNINTGSDLQFNIPNFQASQGNFTAGSISIRGIVNAAVAASSDAAVGTHINGVPTSGSAVLETEFFDIERIEILRGPQGTLYGRNATGGVVNAITAKPAYEFSANLEATVGDYNYQKLTGHVDIPFNDSLGLRLAGYYLERDGYSEALLPDGSKEDVDGRDLYSIRATLGGELTDKASAWLMAQYYEEDSTRTRSTKQLCNKDTRPFPFNQGCVPYELDGLGYARDGNGNPIGIRPGFGTVNSGGTLGGVLAANLGLYSAFGTDSNAGNTTSRDLREYETAFTPTFEQDQLIVSGEFSYDFDNDLTLFLSAAYQEQYRASRDDYNKGFPSTKFNITPFTPDIDGDGDGDWVGGAAFGYNTPLPTGLPEPADALFATDLSSADNESISFEARLQSDYDGPFNFTAGVLSLKAKTETDYYVFFNTAEILGFVTGLPADRTYFRSRSPYELDAFGAFGELYYEMNDDFKWTLGLRYTKDDKEQLDTPSLLLADGSVGPGVLNGELVGAGGLQEASFEELTGRFGFDWRVGDIGPLGDTLLYSFLSRGYKGGGINPPQSEGLSGVETTFDPEFINAFEIGTKSSVFGGRGALNLAAFYYDYEGYQITSIVNRTSVNQNIDAKVMGFEAELFAQLTDNFRMNAAIGVLDTELSDQSLLDTYDQTGGDPDWYVAKNLATTQNCIVDKATTDALLASPFAATSALACDVGGVSGSIFGIIDNPNTTADDAANLAFAQSLEPTIREGNAVDVGGNSLPRAPELTASIGGQYTVDLTPSWQMTLRGDYYYQAEMYSRIFNLEADKIDSWDNANASIAFVNDDGFEFEIYGKNLLEEDQITQQYLTDASSGLFTNVFVLDPLQVGVRIGKSW